MIRSPRFWIALAAAALVCSFAWTQLNRTSPGPLAAVHSRIGDLNGVGSCANCHGGWFGDMTDSCLECHEEIADHMERGRGLHGTLDGAVARACARCHSDHHGVDFAVVNRQSFAAAGVADPDAFDHAMVGFDMNGAHLELACAECHPQAGIRILPENTHRYIGLERRCDACHKDPHEGRMVHACTQCHGQTKWDRLDSAGHDEFLPLVGGHAGISCRTCHAEESDRALERIGRGGSREPRACAACHESPHTPAFAAGVAKLEQRAEGRACVVCHEADHTSWRGKDVRVTPAQHATTGFPLDRPHHEVGCADCHKPRLLDFGMRYPGREPDRCAACHEDVHRGQFEGKQCLDCHERLRFEPHTFTVARHGETKLPLTGRHAETACDDCHKRPSNGAARAFRGTRDDCWHCHRDAHRGAFAKHEKELAETEHGTCAACHGTESFRKLAHGPFDHGRWTDFALDGAHRQEDCEACHRRREKPDGNGRTFGFVSEAFGRYRGCATCHADPHRGEFDRKDLPKEVEGKSGCARCHVTTSFRTFPNGFDHGTWTGFRLDGAHERAGCTTCHAPLAEPDRSGRTWGRAKAATCEECHADPHAGQFVRASRIDCARCHDSAMPWNILRFRHNLDSRFRLDKAHEPLACSACHKPEKIGEEKTVRYRPLGRRCTDCHSHQRNPLRRRGK